MPGNEIGDRVHNFFEQGSLSQDQHRTQLVEGSWPVFNNNLWGGSERQIAGALNSSSKSYSTQQSDIERAQGNQFSLGSNGLSSIESNLRPDFVKNPSQLQQLNLNGFMHSSQVFPTKQNEANFLGVDTEPDRHNLTSRGLSMFDTQQRSGSQHINSSSFGSSESPMNFNFFSGQQQMSGQQPGMLQSLPRQQSSINDPQMMQQQFMLKQMQEIHRQQQLQQLEAMQRNAVNQMSAFPSQMAGQHPQAINGNPLHDTSNYPWSSQVMAGHTNWPQRGQSSAVQGYSNGFMVTPEQGQAMRFMGLIPQQGSQSLYGVPVSNSRTAHLYSHNNIEKPGLPQVPAPSSSYSANQYAPLSEQVCMQDRPTVSRSGSEGKSSFEHASTQVLGNVGNAGSFNQAQQRNAPRSEGGRQDSGGGSEVLPEKSVSQPDASQEAVGLDPTEEKILFGNDVSIWEAFGPSITETGGVSRLDGPDPSNGFPSLQSGTWSALMQSAVAETSSSDAGIQEEWSGLGNQNSRSDSGHQQPSGFHDNEKQKPVWVDSSQRASLGSRTANNDVSTANYLNNSGFQQPFPNQAGSQIPQEGRKWLDQNQLKPHSEQSQAFENVNSSRDRSKTDDGFLSHPQSTFFPDNSGEPSTRPNALNFIEPVSATGGIASNSQNNLHGIVRNRDMGLDGGHDAAMRLESVPNSNVKMGSPHVNSMQDTVAPSLSHMKVNYDSSQKLPDTNHLDLWKPVNSSARSGMEASEKDQPNLNKGPPVLESSASLPDGGVAEMHETENGDRRENSNDNNRSSIPHHAPAGGLRENMWSDVGDQCSLPGDKEKSSVQVGKKAPPTRKFQYHPMGDVDMDMESSYAAKQVLHSQPMSQHLSSAVKGHETQPRFLGPLSSNSTDMEKGHASNFQGAVGMSHGPSSSGIHPGYFPNTSAPFVRSGEVSSNQHVLSSQNMLELLHKVDQFKEQNVVTHHSSSDCNKFSEIASGGPNQNQSTTSHGFNLQLAPPSQGIAPSNIPAASLNSSKPVDSPNSGHVASDKGDRAHAWLTSVSSAQGLSPSHPPSQMQSGNHRSGIVGSINSDSSLQNLKGKLSAPLASGFLYSKNPLHNQHMTAVGGKMIIDQSAAASFDRHAQNHQISDSQDQGAAIQSANNSHHNIASGRSMTHFGVRGLMNQMPVSTHAAMPGTARKDSLSPLGANMWPPQQHMIGAQAQNTSDLLKAQFPPNDASDTNSFAQQKKDDQDGPRKVDASNSQGVVGSSEPVVDAQSTGKATGLSQEEEPGVRHLPDASPSNSAASQKDSEASQHSLKLNNAASHSYSLLHQMQATRSMVTDPSQRESKRLKGTDNGPDTQHIANREAQPLAGVVNNIVRDPSVNRNSIPAGDAKILSFSPQPGNRTNTFQFPHGPVASQDMLSFGRSDPQKFTPGSVSSRVEHAGISPQMAPSWFEQYGTFKNGQLLPVQNVPRIPVTKNVEQFISGKCPNNLVPHNSVQPSNLVATTGQIANSCQATSSYSPSEYLSAPDALVAHVSSPSLVSVRPKKRKTATSDLLPWNKEIQQGFKRLQNMSSAEIEWAQSSNRLVEKVEDEIHPGEDLLPMARPKRRLILTTQLLQQVFRPPSAAFLSLDASSKCEIIVYSLARLTLGDACSLGCCMEGDSPVNLGSGNPPSEKLKTPERIRDQYFSKVMEDFSNRAKELENGLARLDKRASILDFRLDCQDLERFSVINRFARFHGRGQVDGAENSSSSDATAMVQKPFPQRYVSAHPMPRTVPERVQCLSL